MMEERGNVRPLRRHIFAGLAFLAGASLITGCQKKAERASEEREVPKPEPAPAIAEVPAAVALSPVGRPELLTAAAAAADTVAAENALPRSNLELMNRAFELRLPFACGDGILGNWGQWSLDPQTHVLRITIRPQLWGDDPAFKAIAAGMPYDAAEGFWIERPWTRSEQCPAKSGPPPTPASSAGVDVPPTPAAASSPPNTLALVQYFSPDAPRTLRRGNRPYTYTAKLPGDGQSQPKGFRVKLVGRISGFADGQPIHCVVKAPSKPPLCAAAVEFTQVVLEDAVAGENLTEWGS